VRSVQNADRFNPLGMRGSQLVSDYMTNKKRNRIEKLAAVALFDQKGMVWLINERMDHRVRVTPTTNTLIQITCEELK
jgi:tRNA(Ile)-lysidine synthase